MPHIAPASSPLATVPTKLEVRESRPGRQRGPSRLLEGLAAQEALVALFEDDVDEPQESRRGA